MPAAKCINPRRWRVGRGHGFRHCGQSYITRSLPHVVATDMKSQSYAPIWPNGPYLPRLQQGRDFLRVVRMVFLVRKRLTTIFDYRIVCQGLGFLMCWAMSTVPITPNISTKLMLRASLSESLVQLSLT